MELRNPGTIYYLGALIVSSVFVAWLERDWWQLKAGSKMLNQ